jgi:hypothetical protein
MCVHLPHGKNIVKGATQVSGHSLKLHIYMFEISIVKHNSFNCNILFEIFFIDCKVYKFKAWHK